MNLKLKQWIDGYIGKALVAVNVLLVRGLGIVLKRDHSLSKAPENILVIKMLGLGSLLMAADSLYSLKKKYPEVKLILLCGRGVAAGVEPLHLFDEVWVNNDNNILRMVASGMSSLVKAIRLPNLWVLDLEVYSVLTTLFSAWTMARNRFGFQLNKVHFRNYLNTHNVFFNQFITVYQNYEKLVMAMGVQEIVSYEMQNPKTANFFGSNSIAINNTCSELGGDLRKIPASLLHEIVKSLLLKSAYNIVFTGSPSDYDGNEAFIKSYGLQDEPRIKNIAGKLNFADYYSFLQYQCVAMISIDSAPFHMAIKAGLPTLSFWGPINPIQRFRFDLYPEHQYIYLQSHCSPCIHHSDVVPCGGDNFCMKNMNMQMIEPKIDLLLKNIVHD
jgi:ADP-heptose:LPS heptosyltransferase